MVCHQIKLVLTYTLSVQLRSFGMSVILVSAIYIMVRKLASYSCCRYGSIDCELAMKYVGYTTR